MKPSTTFVCAGIALLFLAAFYSIAPTLALFLYSGVSVAYNVPSVDEPAFFALNYFFCEILGIVCLLVGLWKLRNEKCS